MDKQWRCDYGCGTHCRCEFPCDSSSFMRIVRKGKYYVPVYLCSLHAKYVEDNPEAPLIASLFAEEDDPPGWVFDSRRIVFVEEVTVPEEELSTAFSWRGSVFGPADYYHVPGEEKKVKFRHLSDEER